MYLTNRVWTIGLAAREAAGGARSAAPHPPSPQLVVQPQGERSPAMEAICPSDVDSAVHHQASRWRRASRPSTAANPTLLDTTGLCLLSLNGGGVRGLSSLYILKGFTARLNHHRQSDSLALVKPCDIFNLISWLLVHRPPVSPMNNHSTPECLFT